MSDLVKQLRDKDSHSNFDNWLCLTDEAADRIEELEVRVKRLHEVVGIERDAANDALGRLEKIERLAKRRNER